MCVVAEPWTTTVHQQGGNHGDGACTCLICTAWKQKVDVFDAIITLLCKFGPQPLTHTLGRFSTRVIADETGCTVSSLSATSILDIWKNYIIPLVKERDTWTFDFCANSQSSVNGRGSTSDAGCEYIYITEVNVRFSHCYQGNVRSEIQGRGKILYCVSFCNTLFVREVSHLLQNIV